MSSWERRPRWSAFRRCSMYSASSRSQSASACTDFEGSLRRLKFVIAGLDPAIHLREESCLMMRSYGGAHDEFYRDAFSMTCRKLILAAALLLAAPTTVLADAIDGNWCSADGQHMTIQGEDITTPGGKQIK